MDGRHGGPPHWRPAPLISILALVVLHGPDDEASQKTAIHHRCGVVSGDAPPISSQRRIHRFATKRQQICWFAENCCEPDAAVAWGAKFVASRRRERRGVRLRSRG